MALAYVSSTVSSATAPAINHVITMPASIAAGDVLVLLVGAKAFSSSILTPAGWQPLGQVTNGTTAQSTDTGSVLMAAYVKEANGTEAGATLSFSVLSSNSVYSAVYRYTKAAGQSFHAAAAFGTDAAAGASWSVAFTSDPGLTTGDHVILGGVWPTDAASTVSASAIAATGATFTGIVAAGDQNPRITTGNDLGGNTNHASVSAGTASGNATWTHTQTNTTNNAGSAVMVRLREVSPGTPSASLSMGVF